MIAPTTKGKPNKKTPSRVLGLAPNKPVVILAGLTLSTVIAVVLAFFVNDGAKEREETESKSRGKIVQVQPVNVQGDDLKSVGPDEVVGEEINKPVAPSRKQLRDMANGRRPFVPPAYTSHVTTATRELQLFDHPLEHWLARFATIEPGEEILGEPEYVFNERFRRNIAAALANKIELSDADTEEDRELKMAVRDAKKELEQYIKAGEDPCEILIATYKELQNLGLYKKELEAEVKRVVNDREATDEECEAILDAANIMLSERGCGTIKMPSIFKRRIKDLSTKGTTK